MDTDGYDHDNNEPDVRIEEQLRVKIGEAKNLPPRNGSYGLRDCYCVISLDREEIFRTCVCDKTLNPFFGEEFQFEIPRRFRNLAFYLYDRERSVNNKDKVLGKVAIKRDDLSKYHAKESWFQIIPVDADSEVQGKIHLEIKLDPCFKPGAVPLHKIAVRVIDCNELGVINGSCDPYVVVNLYNGLTRLETKRSKIKKKTANPRFDETFYFDIPIRGQNHDRNSIKINNVNINAFEFRISVMHDSSGMFGSVFLGEVKIPLQEINLIPGHNAWYLLQPRDTGRSGDRSGLGSLRIKIHYTSDYVFSGRFYDPLRKLILSSSESKPVTSSGAYILGEIVTNKVDAAQPLIKLFMHYKKIIPLIKVLSEWEISKITDANTIFRGNTLVTKCMDELMKLVGIRYLHETLRGIIEQVIVEHKPCEIDPSRLKDGESIEVNMMNLKTYVFGALRAITSSALRCPMLMCEVFAVLKDHAIKYFPDTREVCYYVISGFVFLRFFAPAILNPKLFEITDQPIDPQTNRTLTLISKTVQSIGNLIGSKCSNQQVIIKEEYMIALHREFLTEEHIESTKVFLELISSSSIVTAPRENEAPIILKESVLTKRAQGRRRIGIGFRNFKKRHFCLTNQEFYYSKAKNKRPLCRIPINEILAVEKLQEESFKMKNMFQVVQKDRALYIQANNCVEEKEWIDILTKVCQTNRNRLKEYHPAAYISGQWLCCKCPNENASGCNPVTPTKLPADLGVHIDPDREVERIHTIFLNNREKIDLLIELCEKQHLLSQRNAHQSNRMPHFVIEDRHTLWETLKELRQCVISLEQNHKQYMRSVCVRTIYGSEQAPIGDDNYLLMLAKHCTT